MDNRVLVILFELIIMLLEAFEVVVEEKKVTGRLVTLILFFGSYFLTVFKFFMLLNSLGFDTAWSVH